MYRVKWFRLFQESDVGLFDRIIYDLRKIKNIYENVKSLPREIEGEMLLHVNCLVFLLNTPHVYKVKGRKERIRPYLGNL